MAWRTVRLLQTQSGASPRCCRVLRSSDKRSPSDFIPFSKNEQGAGFSAPRRVKTLLLFFFHRHGNVRICGKPNFVVLNAGDEAFVDEMMMILV